MYSVHGLTAQQLAQVLRMFGPTATPDTPMHVTQGDDDNIVHCLPVDVPRAERMECVEAFLEQEGADL